jgi:pimeloyl-ACP methyl ester carboxylesterase
MTMKTLFHKELVDEDLVRTRFEMSSGKNYEAQTRRRDAPRPEPITDEISKLKNKTLLLWGRDDHGVALDRGMQLFQIIPRAEMHVFSECGHWCQWDQTARFHNIVQNFLNDDATN